MTTVSQPTPYSTLRAQVAYLADDQVTQPLGVRVVEPPPDTRQALRGNLYAVVELADEGHEQEAFAERLLSTIQRTYYTVKGTQSHVLREALREAKRTLDHYNQESGVAPVKVAIVVAAVLGKRLLIVSNGLGLALVTANRSIDVYPPYTPTAPAEEATEPAGGWEIYRQELEEGGAFLISGRRWLNYVSLRDLAGTVAYVTPENCADAALGLLEQAGQPAVPGALIVLTPAEGRPVAQPSGAGLPQALRRPRLSGLPTSLNATPPVHYPPEAEEERGVAATRTTVAEATYAYRGAPSSTLAPSAPPPDPTPGSLPARLQLQAKETLASVRHFFAGLFPDPASTHSATGNPLHKPPTQAPHPPAEEAEAAEPPYTLPPLRAPARTHGQRARLILLAAVLIVVLVPVAVVVRGWQEGANTRADAEALLDLATARLASGQEAFDAGDKVGARALLAEAQGHVDRARTILVARSPRADQLAVEIQRELNEVLQIQPLYGLVQPLVRFPPDAEPHRVLVVDQDIYVLDMGRQVVQHFRLDLSSNTVADQAGDVVLRQGERIGDAEVGRLVAMTWQLAIPGIEDRPSLLVLDRNNNLFKFDPRVEGVTRVANFASSYLSAPSQIVSYGNRLYVVDQGANRLFRYNPADFGAQPDSWFAEQTPISLGGVQTMSIDGDIWLLFGNGQLVRYRQGVQVSFALENSIPLPGEPVDLAVGPQANSFVYLADRTDQRILVFDKTGTFQRQLQAAEGEPLRGLSGLMVDESSGVMYILTQSALYQHALPN